MKKKEWEEPKLIVLLRGKPEEAILNVCKTEERISGPDNHNSQCFSPTSIVCDAKCLAVGKS